MNADQELPTNGAGLARVNPTIFERFPEAAMVGIILAVLGFFLLSPGPTNLSHAYRAATRNQFSQWTVALQSFKSDYGHYPRVDNAAHPGHLDSDRLAVALTGRHLDGSELAPGEDDVGNTERRVYYAFSNNEAMGTPDRELLLCDSFGNTDIAVLIDNNGDGLINTSDVAVPPTVKAEDGTIFTPGPKDIDLKTGLRAGVLFYSPGDSNGPVFSWK